MRNCWSIPMLKPKPEWVDITKETQQLVDLLDTLPENLRGEAYARTLVQTWGGDVRKVYSLLNYARKIAVREADKADGVKERLPNEIYEYLYKVILEEGVSPAQASYLASEIFDKTEDWINYTKKLSHGKKWAKQVMRKFDSHPVQREMKQKGVIVSRDLYEHNTPHSQLQRLYKGVKLYEWIKGIETSVEVVQEDNKQLKAEVSLAKASIEILEEIVGSSVPNEDKIKILKDSGLSQKDVAARLGVSLSTVKRNWNTCKS